MVNLSKFWAVQVVGRVAGVECPFGLGFCLWGKEEGRVWMPTPAEALPALDVKLRWAWPPSSHKLNVGELSIFCAGVAGPTG